jgi:hypothetical protein
MMHDARNDSGIQERELYIVTTCVCRNEDKRGSFTLVKFQKPEFWAGMTVHVANPLIKLVGVLLVFLIVSRMLNILRI